jgi:hypothetical protein
MKVKKYTCWAIAGMQNPVLARHDFEFDGDVFKHDIDGVHRALIDFENVSDYLKTLPQMEHVFSEFSENLPAKKVKRLKILG